MSNLAVPLTKGLIVVDKSLCAGCRTCEVVCSLFKSDVCSPELSRIQVRSSFLEVDFAASVCLQCIDPPCMHACPAGAISIDQMTGARIINETMCMGCRMCIEECGNHFDPPRLRFDSANQVVLKCDLCGGDPQCVRWCPIGAIIYVFDSAGIRSGHPMEV